MPAETDVPVALADLARVFARLEVRWYVFGAQAVIAAGVPRLTGDIDVTVELPRGGPRVLIDALSSAGIAMRDVGDVDSFIAATRVIPAVHAKRRMPIDVVLAGPGLEEDMLSRVIFRMVGRTKVPFLDTADLIALKLLAGRPKDVEDVAALLRAAPADVPLDPTRQRVVELGAMVDDSTLVATFDRLAAERTGPPRKTSAKPKAPARKLAPRKKPR